MPEFELLCDNLRLTPELENETQLERLKDWWKTNVSRDIAFEGTPQEQYKSYLKVAKKYSDFLMCPSKVMRIQHAAAHGYDEYLNKENPAESDINQLDETGMAPLHWAAYHGYLHTVKALLKLRANPAILNKNSQMPIHSALLVPNRCQLPVYTRKKTIYDLLSKAAPQSLDHQDNSGNSVYHNMALNNHFNNLLKKAVEKNPSALSRPNNLGEYPIHSAILQNQFHNAQTLLESNSDVRLQQGRNSQAPLHYAAKHGSKEMVDLCIKYSNDINVRDTYNKTPLIWAGQMDNQPAIDALLNHHANPDLKDGDRKTWHDRLMERRPHRAC